MAHVVIVHKGVEETTRIERVTSRELNGLRKGSGYHPRNPDGTFNVEAWPRHKTLAEAKAGAIQAYRPHGPYWFILDNPTWRGYELWEYTPHASQVLGWLDGEVTWRLPPSVSGDTRRLDTDA
jgi:hypothetical protein